MEPGYAYYRGSSGDAGPSVDEFSDCKKKYKTWIDFINNGGKEYIIGPFKPINVNFNG